MTFEAKMSYYREYDIFLHTKRVLVKEGEQYEGIIRFFFSRSPTSSDARTCVTSPWRPHMFETTVMEMELTLVSQGKQIPTSTRA
jgi:hypothetical protein